MQSLERVYGIRLHEFNIRWKMEATEEQQARILDIEEVERKSATNMTLSHCTDYFLMIFLHRYRFYSTLYRLCLE